LIYYSDQVEEEEIGRVCSMHGKSEMCKILVRKPEGKRPQDIGIDGRIILKWILRKQRVWTGFIWLRTGTTGRLL
jgi:hypothetical protein